MATNEGSNIQGRYVVVQEGGFLTTEFIKAGSLSIDNSVWFVTPSTSETSVLSITVPADGAELIAASFTPISLGQGSHDQEWSISDGTNVLCQAGPTGVLTSATVGTAIAYTMGTTTNGKSLGTTGGSQLTLTNTSVGTSTKGIEGIHRLVWAL